MSELESLSVEEGLKKHVNRHSIDRLVMLCDGVFAIAITLAALEIHVPAAPNYAAIMSVMSVRLVAYLISFVVIAVFWTSNRDLFARLRRVDRPLTALVLATLCVTALIPASVRIAGPAEGDLGGAFQFYAGIMVVSGALNCSQWIYAGWRSGVMSDEVPRDYRIKRVVETATLPLLFAFVFMFPTVAMLKSISIVGIVAIGMRRLILKRLVN